jgi:hypothetical protein
MRFRVGLAPKTKAALKKISGEGASPTEDDLVVEAMVAGQQDYRASEGRYLSSDVAVAKAAVQNGSRASMGNSYAQLVVAAGHELEPIAEGQQNLDSGADDRGLQNVATCAEATAAVQHQSQASEGLRQRSEVSVGFNAMQVHESGLETRDAGENDAQHNTLSKVQTDFAATLDAAALFPQPAETQANLDTDARALTTQPKENEMHVEATNQDPMGLCTKKTTRDMTKKMTGMSKSKDTTPGVANARKPRVMNTLWKRQQRWRRFATSRHQVIILLYLFQIPVFPLI